MNVSLRTTGLKRRSLRLEPLRERVRVMMHYMRLPAETEVSVLLCGDAMIRVLNLEHRGLDKPTDVLAFAMQQAPLGGGRPEILGDIVISVETARRQAGALKRSLLTETTTLLAHGLLHLLGYDHQTPAEARRMFARQDLLVAAARTPR